jgi:hypothetical protein
MGQISQQIARGGVLTKVCAAPTLFADLAANVQVRHPTLVFPMSPYPTQPSALAQRGKRPLFIQNLAVGLQPYV